MALQFASLKTLHETQKKGNILMLCYLCRFIWPFWPCNCHNTVSPGLTGESHLPGLFSPTQLVAGYSQKNIIL